MSGGGTILSIRLLPFALQIRANYVQNTFTLSQQLPKSYSITEPTLISKSYLSII